VSNFLASTTVSLLRGTSTDMYGDTVDTNIVRASGIPAAITTKSKAVLLPETGTYRTQRMYSGRVLPSVGVQKGDRLRDERSGQVFLVDEVTYTSSFMQTSSCILDLRII